MQSFSFSSFRLAQNWFPGLVILDQTLRLKPIRKTNVLVNLLVFNNRYFLLLFNEASNA